MKSFLIFIIILLNIKLYAITLVKDGFSDYQIIVKENAPQVTEYAAKELQTYIKKVTGVELEITKRKTSGKKALFVGSNPLLSSDKRFDISTYANTERFRIDIINSSEDLVIMGMDCDKNPLSREDGNFGLLFGVYDFLEKFLSVRWYAPGRFGECFELRKNVEIVGLPIDEKPHCFHRSFWPYNAYNEFPLKDVMAFNRRIRAYGLRRSGTNHSMQDLYFFVDREKDYDIFALESNGKTRRFGSFKPRTAPEQRQWADYPQFCFSNPKTLQRYCEFIDAVYKKNPKGKLWINCPPDEYVIHVTPNDNYTTQQCYCQTCQSKIRRNSLGKGTMSNLVFDFVKKVALWAKKKYPKKKVYTLAYEGYYEVPDFELPDNVIIQIAVNPYVIYFGSQVFRKDFDRILKNWSSKVKNISVWHYLLPYDNIPYAMPHIAYQWFRDYPAIRCGFLELNDNALYRPNLNTHPEVVNKKITRPISDWAQSHLNVYFFMRGMWGTKLNVDKELELYYKLFYGPAASAMKKFIGLGIKAWENVKIKPVGIGSSYAKFSGKELYENIYTPEVVYNMKKALEEAKKIAPADSIWAKRIQWHDNSYFKYFLKSAEAFSNETAMSRDFVIIPSRENPVVDGKLDEPFWQSIEENSFVRTDSPLPSRFGTTMKVGVTKDKLLLGIVADDPNCMNAKLEKSSRDSEIYRDDSLEVFIVPDPANTKKFRVAVINLKDVILDYEAGFGKQRVNRAFNSSIKSTTLRNPNGYTMEIAIPLDEFGIKAGCNTVFRMNVCRNKLSGVGENHERSALSCPYGSFWNLQDIPNFRIIGYGDSGIEDFVKPISVKFRFRNCPKGKPKSIIDKKNQLIWHPGFVETLNIFNKENNCYDYYDFGFSTLNGTDISKTPYIELRFRNSDGALNHLITYNWEDADGKTHSDYFRFCQNETFKNWRTRSINIATDGYHARKRTKAGKTPFKPLKFNFFAIYSSCNSKDDKKRHFYLDYIRLTNKPINLKRSIIPGK
jgi:hypothetical protein